MTATLIAVPTGQEETLRGVRQASPDLRRRLLILLLTLSAIAVHGYHPYSEDAGIYVPAIKKLLNPALYPHGSQFFLAPARLSVFSNIVAFSVLLTHVPLSWALLLWHIASVAALLAGCWRLCYLCFEENSAAWCGTLAIAAFLTVPVAGSSLMLSDPYLTSRSLSTPALIFALCFVLEDKIFQACLLFFCALVVHPLMAAYGGVFLISVYAVRKQRWWVLPMMAACISAVALIAMHDAKHFVLPESYQAAVLSRTYFFLSEWAWYEIVGVIAPLCFFVWVTWRERRLLQFRLGSCALAAVLNGGFFFVLALAITRTPDQLSLARYQPMRSFHLLYILMFLLPLNLLMQKILEKKRPAVALLLVMISSAMFAAQRQAFPSSPHLELPGIRSENPWREAFEWVRSNTSRDSLFALNEDYTDETAEDRLGFSAVAERSALANRTKDGGVVAIFPQLAEEWRTELAETKGIDKIRTSRDARSLEKAGVTWIITPTTSDSSDSELHCPYRNTAVAVCYLPNVRLASNSQKDDNAGFQ